MNNHKLKKLLLKFLKEEGIYTFIYVISGVDYINDVDNLNAARRFFCTEGKKFKWRNTKEGAAYWLIIHEKWLHLLLKQNYFNNIEKEKIIHDITFAKHLI